MTQELHNKLEYEKRPWGSYTVLEEGTNYKVKKIDVLPNHRLSYQKHTYREEYWTIVSGNGIITLDGTKTSIKTGDTLHVPMQMLHRIENTGTELLRFIEVQLGSYLGEDDIIRVDDDYGRKQ